jgi:DNA-binding NarL/FixJ family response regulator
VLLADDDPDVRRQLVAVLGAAPGIEVVGEARDGREAIRLYADLSPDVVIVDVVMPRCDGIEATRRILAGAPGACVIVLSGADDAPLVALCIKAGARGVLRKDRGGLATTALMLRLLAIRTTA